MRYQFRPPCGASLLFACLVLAAPLQAAAEDANLGEFVDRTALRVCADPNNLPFSNDRLEGFENKIAALMGQKLGLPVTYVWYPDALGFVRNTLRANRCDVIMGIVAADELVQNTNPYYRSSYVLAVRTADKERFGDLDSPLMLGARIGARLLHVLKGSVIRKMVITLLLFAGLRALLKGLGLWV